MEIKIELTNDNVLDDLVKKLQSIDGTNNIPLPELLTSSFLLKNTNFTSLKEFEEKAQEAGFDIGSVLNNSENITEEWNTFIQKNTKFPDWTELTNEAVSEWFQNKLIL